MTRHPLRAEIERQQGRTCLAPYCSEPWTDLAHIEPSGMGGRPSTLRPENLVGLCRRCHQVFDGHDLKGRQRLLRDLMAAHKRTVRHNRLIWEPEEEE